MNTHMLGEDVRRRMHTPLADLAYLQQRPIVLMPRGLRRRLARRRANAATEHPAAGHRPVPHEPGGEPAHR